MADLTALLATLSAGFAWWMQAAARRLALPGAVVAGWVAMALALFGFGALTGSRRWMAASSWAWTVGSLLLWAWGAVTVVQAAAWAALLVLYWEAGEWHALLREQGVAAGVVNRRPVRVLLGLAVARSAAYGVSGGLVAVGLSRVRVTVDWPLYVAAALAALIGVWVLAIGLREEFHGDSHGQPAER